MPPAAGCAGRRPTREVCRCLPHAPSSVSPLSSFVAMRWGAPRNYPQGALLTTVALMKMSQRCTLLKL